MWTTLAVVLSVLMISRSQEIPKECMTGPDIADLDPAYCCPSAPTLLTNEIIKKCGFNNETKTNCDMADCAAKVGKYLTSDEKVNTTTFKNMAVMIEYPEWGKVFDTLLKNCSSRIEGPNVTCKSGEFFECLMGFELINCPANLWNNTAKCTAFKTFVVICEPYIFARN